MIKFGLIRERKSPPDRRVVFSPAKLKEAARLYPQAQFVVEPSDIRIFQDDQYRQAGFLVTEDLSDCDVLLGVKEVPISALIPNKKYFFFSHTIKQQPYNRALLKSILQNNIELYDHEVIVDERGGRLIGFGRYAGLVGAYNGLRGIGIKEGIFDLPPVHSLPDLKELLRQLDKIQLPSLKILITGSGKVAHGAKEILDHLKVKQVSVEEYLNQNFHESVYCLVDVLDYNKKTNKGVATNRDFYKHPENYVSDFGKFTKTTDFFIAGHFYGQGAPVFFTREDTRADDFRIRYIADISCDIAGPIASTIRPSTIAEPFYGYDPNTGTELPFMEKNSILVMAVDNLPCELPKDASEGFGQMFLERVLPAFFDGDKDGILKRARMTHAGKLTPRYQYLSAYISL